MKHIEDSNLPADKEALLIGLYEQREYYQKKLAETPLTDSTRKKVFGMEAELARIVKRIGAVAFGGNKRYADEQFGYYVFKHIATNPQIDKGKREGVAEAMESARVICKKDKEWVEEVRGNSYLFTKENLDTIAKEGDLDLLIKMSMLNKKYISDSATLNSAATRFQDQKSWAEYVEDIQKRLKEVEKNDRKKTRILEAQQAHIEVIHDVIEGSLPDWKVIASRLKSKGHSQQAIADAVGVGLRTVKRHWKDL